MAFGARMDLVQLRYFACIATLKSFNRASVQLRVAQPALTRQVRLLEEEIGVQLLLRHSRGVEPTASGLILMNGAESVLRLVETIKHNVKECAVEASGIIKVGFPPSFGLLLIGDLVTKYRARYPNVFLEVFEDYAEKLNQNLLLDRLDLAVTSGADQNPLLWGSALFEEELWLLGPADAIEAGRHPMALEALAPLPLILPNKTNKTRLALENGMAARGLAPNIIMEVEALPIIKDFVRRGLGYHVSPYSAMIREIESGEMTGRPLEGLFIKRVLQRRIDRPLTHAIEEMVSAIKAQANEIIRNYSPAIRDVNDLKK